MDFLRFAAENRVRLIRYLLGSVLTAALACGATTVTVTNTVATPNAKRFGVNLGWLTNYDGGQMYKNLIANNPGFEGQLYNSIVTCAASSGPNHCNDGLLYDTWPNNFWAGAGFHVVAGAAAGRSGTVVSSTTSSANPQCCSSTEFVFSPGLPPVTAGDLVILRKTVNDLSVAGTINTGYKPTPVEGWWITDQSGTATTAAVSTDIAPFSPGTQALGVTALGAGNNIGITQYFDSGTAGLTFTQLNGTYQVTFSAKSLGGANQVTVLVARNATLFKQTIALSDSWQVYTCNFAATEVNQTGQARVSFLFNNTNAYLDDVGLFKVSDQDPSNTSNFRDSLLKSLRELRPGVLRFWGLQSGDTLVNALAVPGARKTTHYSINYAPWVINYGLQDFLMLCKLVSAEPWYVVPATWEPSDMADLMEYLGGGPTTHWGKLRVAQGQTEPWTSVFPKIHLEFGNENWNGTFQGGAIISLPQYAHRGDEMFRAAKASPFYNRSKFQMILGAQYVNNYTVKSINAASTHHDAIAESAYLSSEVSKEVASNDETLFGQLFAEVEYNSHGKPASAPPNTQIQNVEASSPIPVVIYEANISTTGGSITQAQIDKYVPSVGVGLGVANSLLMQLRDNGITTQNVYAISQYSFPSNFGGQRAMVPMWGIAPKMDVNGPARPQFIAEQLANLAIDSGADVLTTVNSGDNPTWTQAINYYETNPTVTAHYVQAYAFSNRNLILFNLHRSASLQVSLAGLCLPAGEVTMKRLTSRQIVDNNESAETVRSTTTDYGDFDNTKPLTLPPFSMTVLLQRPPSSGTNSAASPACITSPRQKIAPPASR